MQAASENMVIKSKKGYMKVVESLVAIGLVMFVLSLVSVNIDNEPEREMDLLDNVFKRESFRDCMANLNESCIDSQLRSEVPELYNFSIGVESDNKVLMNSTIESVEKDIFVEQYLFAGTIEKECDYLVKLHYWER